MMYDVLFLGSPTLDIIMEMEGTFPIEGGVTRRVKRTTMEPGGPGNMFFAFNRLGGRILPVGAVGNDDYGRYLLAAYRKEGIETAKISVLEGYATPAANCIIDEQGVHTFVSTFGTAPVDTRAVVNLVKDCAAVCVTGYNLVKEDRRMGDASIQILRRARELKRTVFFDPGPMVGEVDKAQLREVLAGSSVISMNHEEAEIITAEASAEGAAKKLSESTAALLMVKDGARGCYVTSQTYEGRWFDGFRVPLVDTMGAGDSFLGALMYAWISGWDVPTCALIANAAGAVKVSKLGTGTQVPRREEIVDILKRNGYNHIADKVEQRGGRDGLAPESPRA